MKNDPAREQDLFKSQSRARLAASDVIIERLLHDLKQPLNLIRVISQDIKIDCKKDRLDVGLLPESMSEIEQSIDQLVAQIDKLRSFVRPASDRSVARRVDVNEISELAIARIKRLYPEVTIRPTLASSLPPVAIDSFLLEQALTEILDNAAIAVKEDAGVEQLVTLETTPCDQGIAILIGDNGKGVPNEARGALFEPFFTTRMGASGLGLALASAVFTRAGGRIVLGEATGRGALLKAWLPTEA